MHLKKNLDRCEKLSFSLKLWSKIIIPYASTNKKGNSSFSDFVSRLFQFSFRWPCFWHQGILGQRRVYTERLFNLKCDKVSKKKLFPWISQAANSWNEDSMLQRKIFLLMSPYQREGFVTKLPYLFHFVLHFSFFHTSVSQPQLLNKPISTTRGISRWEIFLMTSTHVPEEENNKENDTTEHWCQIPAHQSQLGGSASGEQNTSCYNIIKGR